MNEFDAARRGFLKQSTALAGASWAGLVLPALAGLSRAACAASEENRDFVVLTAAEAREFEAIAARIIPTTDTPGAREAGVVHFFDQTFASFNAPMLNPARGGLQQFSAALEGDVPFSELPESEQDAFLESQQSTPFFGMLQFMTLCGFFGMSKYGGNRDGVGWELVGMTPHTHVYQSPFGYYDAEYLKENPNG